MTSKIMISHSRTVVLAEYSQTRRQLLEGSSDLFETGLRLFSFGYALDEKGKSVAASEIYVDTVELLEYAAKKRSSLDAHLSLARLALEHSKRLFSLKRLDDALAAVVESVELYETMREFGITNKLASELADALDWLAKLQHLTGEPFESEEVSIRASSIRNLANFMSHSKSK